MSQTICSGTATTLINLTSSVGGAAFVWTATGTTGLSGFTANGTNTIPVQIIFNSQNTPGTATYSITSSALTCTATATYTVNVNPTPVIPPLTATICNGNTFSILPVNSGLTIVPAGTTYTWSAPLVTGGITGSSAQSTGLDSISQLLTHNTYSDQTATYTVTPQSGAAGACVGADFTATITVHPSPPPPFFSTDTVSVCTGSQNVMYTINTIMSGYNYLWSTNNATTSSFFTNSTSCAFSFPYTGVDTIFLKVTNQTTGCKSIHNKAINVVAVSTVLNPAPTIIFLTSQLMLCSLAPQSGLTYQWGFDDLPSMTPHFISGATSQQYLATDYPNPAKAYWVKCMVAGTNNCFTISYIGNPLSVDNNSGDIQFVSLFPNPANSSVNLKCSAEIVSYRIVDIAGKQIMNTKLTHARQETDVDIKELSNGIYFIGVETIGNPFIYQKLVVQK